MADRRMFSREIFQSSVMVKLGCGNPGFGLEAQRIWETLILKADDYGRGKLIPGALRSSAFGTTPCAYGKVTPEMILEWVGQIEEEGAIIVYEVDGDKFYALSGWEKYQRGDWRRGKSKLPNPPPFPDSEATAQEQLDNSGGTVSDSPRSDTSTRHEIEIESERESLKKDKKKRESDKSPPSQRFIQAVCELFPDLDIKKDQERIIAQAAVLEEIERIDGTPMDDLMPALKWAVSDDFWKSNFQSCAGLRKRKEGKGDRMKYEKIYAKFKSRKKRVVYE